MTQMSRHFNTNKSAWTVEHAHGLYFSVSTYCIVDIFEDDGSFIRWCREKDVLEARSPTKNDKFTSYYFSISDALKVQRHLENTGERFSRSNVSTR